MRIINKKILDSAAIVADESSEVIALDFMYGVSLQIRWTSSTAAGTVHVQGSNVEDEDDRTWVTVSTHDQTVNNNSGDVLVNIGDVFYKYIRVSVDWVSGSITTLDVILNGKGI